MCKCTPNIRTPFCGKPGCTWPKNNTQQLSQQLQTSSFGGNTQRYELIKETPDELLEEIHTVRRQIAFLEGQALTLSLGPNTPKDTIQMLREDIRELKLDLIILQTTKI